MSSNTNSYSDEMLNAYLDNELASDERKRIMLELRSDKELQERVCRLEQVRNMVSIAYHDIADPRQPERRQSAMRLSRRTAIAASLFIAIGALAGWSGHNLFQREDSLISLARQLQINDHNNEQTWKVLLHVTSDEPHRLVTLLDETENILREYEHRRQKVAIQILANGNGLNLLRSDKSIYGKRIAALQSRYHNLIFMACAKAMAQVQNTTGRSVPLLPNTQITPSALGEVLHKQREGWTYIRI